MLRNILSLFPHSSDKELTFPTSFVLSSLDIPAQILQGLVQAPHPSHPELTSYGIIRLSQISISHVLLSFTYPTCCFSSTHLTKW